MEDFDLTTDLRLSATRAGPIRVPTPLVATSHACVWGRAGLLPFVLRKGLEFANQAVKGVEVTELGGRASAHKI